MTARDTYNSSVSSAEKSKLNTIAAAETAKQATISLSSDMVGYTLQSGNYANFAAAVKNANAAKLAALLAAEQTRQGAADAAREVLRGTGDLGPT
jgi:hypothetical protein